MLHSSCRYLQCLHAAAEYVMTENVALAQVDLAGFQALMLKLDSKYPRHSSYLVQSAADKLCAELKLGMKAMLNNAKSVLFTSCIW